MIHNIYAIIIKIIGIVTIIVGLLTSLILGTAIDQIIISVAGSVSSFIVGVVFVGFGEIIELLQANYDTARQTQKKIDRILKNTKSDGNEFIPNNPSDEENRDVNPQQVNGKSKLQHKSPFQPSDTQWRCKICNTMVNQSPCPFCGCDSK